MKKLLLLLLVVLCAVVVGVRQHMVAEADFFAVESGSMGESAPIGSLVVVRASQDADVGDIITYDLANGQLVTHRVVEVDADGHYLTKGDTNEARDPWTVSPQLVRGVVDRVYPGYGYAFVFLSLPAGMASILTGLLTLVLLWKLFFPDDERDPEHVDPTEGSADTGIETETGGARRGSIRRLTTAALAAVIVIAVFTPAAGAEERTADRSSCDMAMPDLDLAGLMPGESRTVALEVCNHTNGARFVTVTTAARGALGSLVDVSIDDLWAGTLDELATPLTIDGAPLRPGERRTYRILIGLAAGADNRWANREFEMDLSISLGIADATEVLGNTVENSAMPSPGGSAGAIFGRDVLPRTGPELALLTLAAASAIGVGAGLRRYRALTAR